MPSFNTYLGSEVEFT